MSDDAALCFWCKELVVPGEGAPDGITAHSPKGIVHHPLHEECAIRSVIGSVGHQRKQCSCYGGTEEDPPGMTKRQAARVAMWEWKGMELWD